jgi:hypothetical protein
LVGCVVVAVVLFLRVVVNTPEVEKKQHLLFFKDKLSHECYQLFLYIYLYLSFCCPFCSDKIRTQIPLTGDANALKTGIRNITREPGQPSTDIAIRTMIHNFQLQGRPGVPRVSPGTSSLLYCANPDSSRI